MSNIEFSKRVDYAFIAANTLLFVAVDLQMLKRLMPQFKQQLSYLNGEKRKIATERMEEILKNRRHGVGGKALEDAHITSRLKDRDLTTDDQFRLFMKAVSENKPIEFFREKFPE